MSVLRRCFTINNYVYRCLNEYNEIIYVSKLIRFNDCLKNYFKNESKFINYDIILYTYKIEVLAVNYEIDAYSINAYLINKYRPKFNLQKNHYKNINQPYIYNESDWKLVKIVNPDLIPIKETYSILDQYFHLLIILLVPIIIVTLYIVKGIIL